MVNKTKDQRRRRVCQHRTYEGIIKLYQILVFLLIIRSCLHRGAYLERRRGYTWAHPSHWSTSYFVSRWCNASPTLHSSHSSFWTVDTNLSEVPSLLCSSLPREVEATRCKGGKHFVDRDAYSSHVTGFSDLEGSKQLRIFTSHLQPVNKTGVLYRRAGQFYHRHKSLPTIGYNGVLYAPSAQVAGRFKKKTTVLALGHDTMLCW
jgi:hypothetical protein